MPQASAVNGEDVAGSELSNKRKKSGESFGIDQKPPVVVTIIVAILTSAVTAVVIPYVQSIISELSN